MEPKLIIYEGPDACGKTTLAKATANALGGVYWHMTCTSLLATAMKDYQLNAIENIKENLTAGRSVVIDRLWPSEVCYGGHFRGITIEDMSEVISGVARLKPTYVFTMDAEGAEAAERRHQEHLDPAHPYDMDDFIAVYKRYEDLIGLHGALGFRVKHFDTTPQWQQNNEAWLSTLLQELGCK